MLGLEGERVGQISSKSEGAVATTRFYTHSLYMQSGLYVLYSSEWRKTILHYGYGH